MFRPVDMLRLATRCLSLAFILIQMIGGEAAVQDGQITEPQNPYFKEILMGRCYESPPNQSPEGGADLCPVLVPSLLGVLEGQLDENIDPDAYFMYMGWTKYDLPKNSALLVWPPPATMGTMDETLGWVMPETSPSGSLVKGLVFCGADRRMDCPTEFWKLDSGAMLSFWKAVYSDFASKMQGQVKMMILEEAMVALPNLWDDSVLPNMDLAKISGVDIMASNCDAPGVAVLTKALHSREMVTTCAEIEKGLEVQGSLDLSCGVADIMLQMNHSLQGKDGTSLDPLKLLPPPPPPSSGGDCDCPTSIYAYLFWGIILLGVAGAYSAWSVWHYLPEYQRIPNVENGERGGLEFPKQ